MKRFPTERPADFVDDLKVPAAPDALFFIVREGKLLLSDAGELPSGHSLAGQAVLALGRLGERPVFALPLTGEAPAGAQLVGLRQCFGVLPDGLFGLAGLAVQLVDFQRSHQFCGACDTPTQPGEVEEAQWFTVSDLPRLPPTFTASRRLLDDALATLRPSGDFATT